jgi:hypothetical protein
MPKLAIRPDDEAYKAAAEYSEKVVRLLQMNEFAHKKVLEQYRSIQAARFRSGEAKVSSDEHS